MFANICKCCRVALAGLVILISIMFGSFASAQTAIVCVNGTAAGLDTPAGPNPGDSWTNAYRYLQDGLGRATALLTSEQATSVQVWVLGSTGDGITYYPDENAAHPHATGGTDDAGASFVMHNNIAIYGGFAGTESIDATGFALRNYNTNLVTLSGDLLQNDDPEFPFDPEWTAENCNNVVASTNVNQTAVLDGVTVRGALSGGMSNYGASPRVAHCVFTANSHSNGGGGMLNYNASNPIVVNCSFIGNKAGGNGGGMYNWFDSAPTVVNCKFINNTSGHVGGGMGIRASETAVVHVTNCLFQGNSSPDSGGGVRAGRDSRSIFTNCTFVGNSTGGGSAGYPIGGGGFALGSDSVVATVRTTDLINCVFWDNQVTGGAQGPDVANCGVSYGILSIDHTDVPGGESAVYLAFTNPPSSDDPLLWGTHNIDADPQFVDQANGDFRLDSGSACIDKGSNGAVPDDTADVDDSNTTTEKTPWDLALGTRFCHQQQVDMGAFEGSVPLENCVGDVNGSGLVNIDDLLLVIQSWGPCASTPAVCDADIAPNPCGDSTVGIDDLLAVIQSWGNTCEGGIANVGSLNSVEDCMDRASTLYTPYSTAWTAFVQRCTDALCARHVIVCD